MSIAIGGTGVTSRTFTLSFCFTSSLYTRYGEPSPFLRPSPPCTDDAWMPTCTGLLVPRSRAVSFALAPSRIFSPGCFFRLPCSVAWKVSVPSSSVNEELRTRTRN